MMKRRITRKTKKYRIQSFPCPERERLRHAYQDALQKKHTVEDMLDREVVSPERGRAGQAKNKRKHALGHAIHVLSELMAHERKNGCVRRTPNDVAPIEDD